MVGLHQFDWLAFIPKSKCSLQDLVIDKSSLVAEILMTTYDTGATMTLVVKVSDENIKPKNYR